MVGTSETATGTTTAFVWQNTFASPFR
ncbi:TPA: hypothetical protein ROY17_005783 [Bacillus thuringiensis]|nr:hypothetical protein [Bacillus thuringiensis]